MSAGFDQLGAWLKAFRILCEDESTVDAQFSEHFDQLEGVIVSLATDAELAGADDTAPAFAKLLLKQRAYAPRILSKREQVLDELMIVAAKLAKVMDGGSEAEPDAPLKPSRKQPEKEITKWVRANIHKYDNNAKAVRSFIEIHSPRASYSKLYQDLANDLRSKPLAKPK